MVKTSHLMGLFLLALFAAGCSSINNLTPSRQVRNPDGIYPFEVEWISRLRALRPDSIKAYVEIDLDSYPMRRTLLLSNRWETLVPVPADRKHITYRYKFDYEYDSIPRPRSDSLLSPPYQLTIMDR
jgi:hypothetical protein